MTTTEAAEEIGCSVGHVGHLLRKGLLRGSKRGRDWDVNRSSVLAYARKFPSSGFPRGTKRRGQRGTALFIEY